MTDLLVAVGARPNFMKAAPVIAAAEREGLETALVHTDQHYDRELSQIFFDELGLPEPTVRLGVRSGTHAKQTASVMIRFERTLAELDPSAVVVVGDVNSTLACALVAAKEHYPVAHVEAGLRSFDERMPEEINRKLVDHISSVLFTVSSDANENLRREGIDASRISLVGNTMVDTLFRFADAARERDMPGRLGLSDGTYAVATLHRPENVDDPLVLARLTAALAGVSTLLPVVVPLHPRTRQQLERHGLSSLARNLRVTPPLGYLDFIGLVAGAALVLTDSGGLQEETTALGIPCLTMRESTERPITVWSGTNEIVASDPVRIVATATRVLEEGGRLGTLPPLWDGHAGERIAAVLRAAVTEEAELAHTGS